MVPGSRNIGIWAPRGRGVRTIISFLTHFARVQTAITNKHRSHSPGFGLAVRGLEFQVLGLDYLAVLANCSTTGRTQLEF